VWALLQAFMDAHSTKEKLRERVGQVVGTGRGKVRVLMQLDEQSLTLGDIAQALQVDRPYATVLVNQLEEIGLVERTPDPGDRRRKIVALTAAGREAMREATNVLTTPPPELAALDRADLRRLGAVLAKLVPASKEQPPRHSPAAGGTGRTP
jgi:DNA-binding MarR family transcriptional regulator